MFYLTHLKNDTPTRVHSVLVTNVRPSGDNVMVYTSLPSVTLEKAFRNAGVRFDECYSVKPEERQYYLAEPCWLSGKEEARAKELAKHTD
jgi:hypothetical protein